MMKKKEKTCLKSVILIFFNVIQMILTLNLVTILGEISLYISKLREKKAANEMINKITKDFEKIVAVTKSKELKQYTKSILPNYEK